MKHKWSKIVLLAVALLIIGGGILYYFVNQSPVTMKVSNQIISIGIK